MVSAVAGAGRYRLSQLRLQQNPMLSSAILIGWVPIHVPMHTWFFGTSQASLFKSFERLDVRKIEQHFVDISRGLCRSERQVRPNGFQYKKKKIVDWTPSSSQNDRVAVNISENVSAPAKKD